MKLFVAVPAHSRSIAGETAESLIYAQSMMIERGGSFQWHWESGATISVVRNVLVARFLQTNADLLLMLDADQAVWPGMLQRMIDFDQPVVGCIYPKRMLDWSKADLSAAADIGQLLYQASEFVGWLEADENGQALVANGFAKATHVGTGILLIRRQAFSVLMNRFPELQGRGFTRAAYPELDGTGRWGFFNMLEDEEGVQISEDLSFCRRWRETGGDIWAEVGSSTIHVGPHTFAGNYLDYLRATGAA